MIQLSIDDSIKRLKTEVIAQDWGLSTKRIELLDAAFFCLKQRFKNRKAAHAILIMAGSVLEYVKRKGENTPADSIDFLKESMAHVVNLYESEEFDPEEDEKLFKGLYYRFNNLKEKIKTAKTGKQSADTTSVQDTREGRNEVEVDRDTLVPESIEQLRKKVADLRQSDLDLEKGEVERLVYDLQASLERAEYVGDTISRLLTELLASRDRDKRNDEQEQEQDDELSSFDEKTLLKRIVGKNPPPVEEVVRPSLINKCPPTQLRKIVLAGTSVYIQENAISLIRQVSPEKLKGYIKNSNVPLKDFGGFFHSLSRQFKGLLSQIPDKKLKKLSLPIVVPSGFNLPDMPDENGSHLVFVVNAHWNGVLVCAEVDAETVTMVKFQKAPNGDVAGIGFSEEDHDYPLLHVVSVLRREGFLTMV